MKAHLHRVLFLCLVPSLLSSSSLTIGPGKSTWACVGGPPNYCPRQDVAVQNLNNLSLTLGPTGNTGAYFVDADLGSRIVRVTDNNTETPSVGCCVNNSSAESQEWGIYDPTLFSGWRLSLLYSGRRRGISVVGDRRQDHEHLSFHLWAWRLQWKRRQSKRHELIQQDQCLDAFGLVSKPADSALRV